MKDEKAINLGGMVILTLDVNGSVPDPLHFIVYKEFGHDPFYHWVTRPNDMGLVCSSNT
jgi:hypothetical protein